jgi:very-long-chain (3R)-3-hydroxyacyl-CoA dehydratase
MISRYTMFYPLYPIGIGAEWWLLYRAIEPAAKVHGVIPPIFYFCLLLYIPGKLHVELCIVSKLTWDIGSYQMYTYMIKQRKKTLGHRKKAA